MGLFRFDNLPVNTLVGADRKTFRKVLVDREIGDKFKTKFRTTKCIQWILNWFYIVNERKYRKFQPAENIEDPVFIIGHWRSGTTFVHNVISKDPKFGYCTTYQTVFPHLMLWGRGFFRWCMKVVMPSSRPTDSLELNPDQPQEEEFALANMSPCSYYHFWCFPRHIAEYRRKYLVMNDLTDEERAEFNEVQKKMINLALNASGKRQFLSKNPPHTGRVKELLELYPNAKFIYLVRNPYTVYKSTMSFIGNTLKTTQLQDISSEELEKEVLETYVELYDKYEADKGLIPEGHLIEVRFEDFEKDPVAMAEKIYKTLDLGDFESVKPLMEAYAGQKRGFRKNKYQYDEKTVSAVNAHWGKAVEKWGYTL
ncbi:MAG: sulfotransferase family protein [Candidatus Cryptobacteroides sp.]